MLLLANILILSYGFQVQDFKPKNEEVNEDVDTSATFIHRIYSRPKFNMYYKRKFFWFNFFNDASIESPFVRDSLVSYNVDVQIPDSPFLAT